VIWRARPPAPPVEVEPASDALTPQQVAAEVADLDEMLRIHTVDRPPDRWNWTLIDFCLEDRTHLLRYGRRRGGAR
jgi:hypothetical protein